MNATSAWLLAANTHLNDPGPIAACEQPALGYSFKVYVIGDSRVLVAARPTAAGSPGSRPGMITKKTKDGNQEHPVAGDNQLTIKCL